MAETSQKKRGPGRPPGSKNKVNHAAAPSRNEQIDEMQRKYDRDRRNVDVIWSITLVAIGLFLFFTVVMDTTGSFGMYIHDFCLGLFGMMAYALPFLVFIFAILLLAGKLQHIGWRTVLFSFLIFINMCVLNSYRFIDENNLRFGFSDIADQYRNAIQGIEGGVMGMEIGSLLVKFFGKPGLLIIAFTVIIISVFLVANTPISRFVEKTINNREKKKMLAELLEKNPPEKRAPAAASMPQTVIVQQPIVQQPVVPEKKKGVRAIDMQDTIVMSAEEYSQWQKQHKDEKGILGSVKSVWRSLVGGLTTDESDIFVLPNKKTSMSPTKQVKSADEVVGIPEPFSNTQAKNIAHSRVIVKDPSPTLAQAEERDKDTIFDKLAKRFTDYVNGKEESAEEDYGYPGDRKKTEARPVYNQGRSGYGLGADPDEIVHSGQYGLDGHPKAGSTGLGDSFGGGNAAGAGMAASVEARKAEKDTKATTAKPAPKPAKAPKTTAASTSAKSKAEDKVSKGTKDEDDAKIAAGFDAKADDSSYELPPISLLKRGSGPKHVMSQNEIGERAALLEKTLNDFGVEATVINVTQGASVTRYEVQPATGVKVSRITRLADDIALNMRAKTVRIEAPIPGKAAVGIEVENAKPSPVLIRELIDSEEFMAASSKIEFVVGKDISGNNIVADMKDMPHLLVAGATGSGKSVCINSIITSFLYKAKPSELKLIMIDPKMVELGNYNGIPHMLTPVVTDPRKAARALAIAVEEMEKRYEIFSKEYVKDLGSYNEKMRGEGRYADCKPEIIIIIDELADLMMAAPNDVENAICRLAQKARAAGMHLIVATQRPSVDVVTGLIKANIPSRIAFTTTSSIDSRTILDTTGAEKLLGKGDMLFSPVGSTKPFRVQGPYISAEEIEKVIKFVKKEGGDPEYDEELKSAIDNLEQKGSSGEPQDELTEDAIAYIFKSGQASVSMLQRRFRIGYNRAARIIDEIEEKGIIGPQDGARPRQLLMSEDMYYGGQSEPEEVYEEPEEVIEELPEEVVEETAEPITEEAVQEVEAEPVTEETEEEEAAVEETVEEPEYEVFEIPEEDDEESIDSKDASSDLDNDPVLNELVYGEMYDDIPFDSAEEDREDTLHVMPEEVETDVMDPADDGVSESAIAEKMVSANTGVNAFNSLSPEQQAKLLDADYEDEY